MKGNKSFISAETGQARLAVILAVLILVPLGFSFVSQVSRNKTESFNDFLEKPDTTYEECIRETTYMRFHHWELLRATREEVVRYGIRSDVSLNRCSECHTHRERFCDKCHQAASLTPDCFGCHYYP